MGRPGAFDGMLHEFCTGLGWCGSEKDGKWLHVTDLIPPTGPVSADQFARYVVMAEGFDPDQVGAAILTQLEAVFVKHMGATVIDASNLCSDYREA
jgi:hypothetical protein